MFFVELTDIQVDNKRFTESKLEILNISNTVFSTVQNIHFLLTYAA